MDTLTCTNRHTNLQIDEHIHSHTPRLTYKYGQTHEKIQTLANIDIQTNTDTCTQTRTHTHTTRVYVHTHRFRRLYTILNTE
jgi:hypothetical protein